MFDRHSFRSMWKVIREHIKDNPALWIQTGVLFITLVVLAITLGVLVWQVSVMRDEVNLMRDEVKLRQRPFFGLTRPEVQFLDKDPDVTKHEIFFTMNFENKGPVPANAIKIDQKLYYVKKDLKIEKPGNQLFKSYKAEGISILSNQIYPRPYMEHLKTLEDKLFKEYGELTKPGFLLILTDIKYHGMKEEPQYFQETVYLFEWVPAHAKKGVFHLLKSKSN